MQDLLACSALARSAFPGLVGSSLVQHLAPLLQQRECNPALVCYSGFSWLATPGYHRGCGWGKRRGKRKREKKKEEKSTAKEAENKMAGSGSKAAAVPVVLDSYRILRDHDAVPFLQQTPVAGPHPVSWVPWAPAPARKIHLCLGTHRVPFASFRFCWVTLWGGRLASRAAYLSAGDGCWHVEIPLLLLSSFPRGSHPGAVSSRSCSLA